jgi:glycosyltransferase involved in cell wall biosynthesis
MKILQIGNADAAGARINGFNLSKQLRKAGVESENCVWEKKTDDTKTYPLVNFPGYKKIHRHFRRLENMLSLQSVLYPFSFALPFKKYFRNSDIVHYHIIHNGFFSLLALPLLTKLKPSIWSAHDPWIMTGHCMHQYECERWMTGCGNCPNLNTPFKMKRDNTRLMWNLKNKVYKNSKIDVVVDGKWMFDLAKKSPLLSNFKIHMIPPVGLDLNLYKPKDKIEARNKLGIGRDNFVIFFRATESEYKGLPYIKECLRNIKTDKPKTILTVDQKNLMNEFKDKFQVIDLGWTEDDETMVNAYNACDVFLMPSVAENFGVMAVEAMACGKPVLTFKGTGLESTIFSPQGGIAVPMGDSNALAAELQNFIDHPAIGQKIGKQGVDIAAKHYSEKIYINKIIDLYQEVLSRKHIKHK